MKQQDEEEKKIRHENILFLVWAETQLRFTKFFIFQVS